MADNLQVTAGSGTTIAADDISSVLYQRVKLGLGADGTAVDWVGGSGTNGTGVARVTLATDDATAVSVAAIETAVELLDNAVYVDDADFTDGVSSGLLKFGLYQSTPQSITDGDVGPIQVDANGNQIVHVKSTTSELKNFIIRSSPTVTAGAYSAGDVFGTKMTLTNAARVSGGSGKIRAVSMFDEGANILGGDIEVIFFDADPSGSTFSDNAALAIVDADGPKIIGSVILADRRDTGDGGFCYARNLDIPYVCVGSANLFAVAVQLDTTAPDATDGITFTFHLERD